MGDNTRSSYSALTNQLIHRSKKPSDQGRSNGLKGGGTPKFRLAPSALASTSPGIFQAKYLVLFFASKFTNGNFLQIISVLDKMKGICKPE